jgi:hypothetical protein
MAGRVSTLAWAATTRIAAAELGVVKRGIGARVGMDVIGVGGASLRLYYEAPVRRHRHRPRRRHQGQLDF